MASSYRRVCQSCGMPLAEPVQYGSNSDGTPNLEYCTYCFQKGGFTNPSMKQDEMVDLVTRFWADRNGVALGSARRTVGPMIAGLKRWRYQA